MVLVRIVFHAKLGKAREAVEGMKRMATSGIVPNGRMRILTDLSGEFDTVVQEIEVESVDAYLQAAEKMFADPRWRESTASALDVMLGGSKEYYTIEYQQ